MYYKCEKCGSEWTPPKNISVSISKCPFCGAAVLNADIAKSYTDIGDFLQYLVSIYGAELYDNTQKLNNMIADLYCGEERTKRVYRRAILDDLLPKHIRNLSLHPLNERVAFYNRIINQFAESNFYSPDFCKQVVNNFVAGLRLEIYPTISTEATDEDGEWIDEFGVIYSANRKKLIKANELLEGFYEIKEGTVVICNNAFHWCASLESVTIPNSVTSIGNGAFSNCYSLKSITIPNSVTSIGSNAFYRCGSLESITIPNSVTSIGNGVFSGCKNLVLNLESTAHFVLKDGILYTADMKALLCCFPAGMKQVNISVPPSVTRIGDNAFDNCESLKSITIPDSVTSIGNNAFYGCESLESITIPNSVTSIRDNAFSGCISLRSITIPNSVTSIGNCAFEECESLESITIPESVTYIGDGAFYGCKSLESITIPNSVTRIGYEAFSECSSLESVTIPNSVTSIGDWAFEGCKSLKIITIPNSVTSIGNKAFYWCKSLKIITIPNSVSCIGDWAFAWCSSLESIFIPQGSRSKFEKLLSNYKALLHEI